MVVSSGSWQFLVLEGLSKMKKAAFGLSVWVALASAGYHGNLNYRSPSLSHDGLGIDLPKVKGRMLRKRDVEVDANTLSFTHGVASVSKIRVADGAFTDLRF